MSITDFLLARVAEDEALAQAAGDGRWFMAYTDVVREDLHGYDEWQDAQFAAGHELERKPCVACWDTYCHLRREDMERDVQVAHFTPAYGDTAVGKQVANGNHIARHDPTRVLAECKAKRAICERAAYLTEYGDTGVFGAEILRHLAAVYSGHADYQQEWAV